MHNGQLITLSYGGREMLHRQQGFVFNGYRSINNDPRDHLEIATRLNDFDYKQSADGKSVRVTVALSADSEGDGSVSHTLVYVVNGNGAIDVEASFHTSAGFNMPRLALQASLSPALEQVDYFGRGPIENYADRKNAAYVGLYHTTVSDMRRVLYPCADDGWAQRCAQAHVERRAGTRALHYGTRHVGFLCFAL